MRKRILRDYVLVVTAALLCGFLIFYLVVSNIMMESTKNDLHYTLKTLEALPREELIARDDALSQTLEDENSRITIIDADGDGAFRQRCGWNDGKPSAARRGPDGAS